MYVTVNARGNPVAEYPTREAAYSAGNQAGLATAEREADGRLALVGADPRVWQVLGWVHVGESYRTALRRVITLFSNNTDGKDYRDYEERGAPCPGWRKFRSLDFPSRHLLMVWVAWIHREHQQTYRAVMCGPM